MSADRIMTGDNRMATGSDMTTGSDADRFAPGFGMYAVGRLTRRVTILFCDRNVLIAVIWISSG